YISDDLQRSFQITTIHHDKPEESNIHRMATTMTSNSTIELNNVTLTHTERQKRLLPYVNFYQSGNQNQVTYEKYPPTVPKKVYPVYNEQNSDIVYHHNLKLTPFSVNNAIPGPFKPMMSAPSRVKVQYVPLPQHKVPNFSEIYDKLAQLKLSQSYRRPAYFQIKRPSSHQSFLLKPQVYNEHKLIQPSKTTIETYTATNIDIPTGPGDTYQYNTQKNFQQNKPYINSQIAVEIPYSSIPQENYKRKPYQEFQKPFIIVPASPPDNRNKQVVIIEQRKPILSKNPDSYEPSQYENQYQLNTPQYEEYEPFPKYEQEPIYEDIPRYEQIQYKEAETYVVTPKYEEPPKYIEVPKYEEPPKYVEAPKYEEPPKYVEAPKYKERSKYIESSKYIENPKDIDIPKYEAVPKYIETPKYVEAPKYEKPPKNSVNLAIILKHLQATNTLPKTLTPDNIDNSIKTLVKILNALKKQSKLSKPIVVQEQVAPEYIDDIENDGGLSINEIYPEDTDEGGTPGKPGVDYPALSSIPQTSFNCKTQRYKGFFGDPDTHCQVWHYCDLNGGQASFLCPNGTIFSQVALTCDWWYNVKCSSTAQLYVLNERLYKYIIPLSPKFPEDYTGPLVDKYLALKFQEMEEKMRKEKKGKGNASKEEDDEVSEKQDVEAENTEKIASVESTSKSYIQKETLQTVEDDNKN
uniref:Titin n=1 Tax=Diabrotica virgifera virgifera TaxID=50390 RepID=A0A6P7FKN2_DIAVI